MDGNGKNNRELYILVGEIKGKLDQLALQLNGYFDSLSKQVEETNKKISKIEETLERHQSDLDVLKTRDKIYRASIVFIATLLAMIMVDLFHKIGWL